MDFHLSPSVVTNCAFVDGVAVRIDLQRTIKMRALVDGPVAVVLYHAAPEDGLALIVGSLEFQPRVVSIDSAAWEEVADFFCAHDHIHAHRIAPTQRRLNPIQRSRDGNGFAPRIARDFALRLFADRERGG